jgi:MFS family permease
MEGMSNDWMTRYFKNAIFDGADQREREAQLALVTLTGAMTVTRFGLSAVLKRVSSRVVMLTSVAITACGALVLSLTAAYNVSLVGALLIGIGLAPIFPVALGFVGDRYTQLSGTAFSTIFVLALAGNMIVNKAFGHLAQEHGVSQYPTVMLGLVACSAALIYVVCSLFARSLR